MSLVDDGGTMLEDGGITLKNAKPAYMYVDIHMYNTQEEGHWSHLSEI